ncbi:MAG: class I tRNA ligase family protein, partial [Myxococcota bacterium]|nr:class I tRNA ligase family protein [Myxococcota bacterium]
VAEASRLPVDPTVDVPPGYEADQRGAPGGFRGDPDVFDTWFTSSLTPQIASGWLLDPDRHAKLFPADLRPQAHEIIRTWAFYTLAKSMLHEDRIPWRHIVVSGWILDPDRKKMSKSKGNVVTPMHLLEQYTADAVRYWAASARLGVDTAFDEKVFKVGKRLVTKLYNASKFVLSQTAAQGPVTAELDRAFLGELAGLVERATRDFEAFEYARVLQETESFFWTRFTDSYLELAKARARSEEDPEGRTSAVATLRTGLSVLLRLFAPFLPYITEELWSWVFADERGEPSVHRARWPEPGEIASAGAPEDPASFRTATAALAAIHKAKADAEVSIGREVERLVLRAAPATRAAAARVAEDVFAAARCREARLEEAGLEEGRFEVAEIAFAARPGA